MYMESRKSVLMNLSAGQWWDADIESRLVNTVAEGEGGMNWESSIETYALQYVKLDSQEKFAVWCRKLKPSVLQQSRGVGWDGRQEGG